MLGVLHGVVVIGFVIGLGYLLIRTGAVAAEASRTLSQVAFYVATPAIVFNLIATADLRAVLSVYMIVAVAAAVIGAVVYLVVARAVLAVRGRAELAVGACAAVFVNSNNIGLPVAQYVLGDLSVMAAILIMQPLVLATTVLTILDLNSPHPTSLRRVLLTPLRSPVLLAAGLGLVVSATGVRLPAILSDPLDLLAGAAIPLILLSFGMSLPGQRPLRPGADRPQVLLAVAVKSLVMPLAAWVCGAVVLNLDASTLFAVVVIAALPTGQVVFTWAATFKVKVAAVRDTVLLTTLMAAPLLLVIAALLAP
ncbi:MAG: AEC family transporter [Beutenbergiaceae bacterium]